MKNLISTISIAALITISSTLPAKADYNPFIADMINQADTEATLLKQEANRLEILSAIACANVDESSSLTLIENCTKALENVLTALKASNAAKKKSNDLKRFALNADISW
jgi:hypothetical protein